MSIKIEIFGDTAEDALREIKVFSIGLIGKPAPTPTAVVVECEVKPPAEQQANTKPVEAEMTNTAPSADVTAEPETAEAPKRERGKPSAGRARRTKEEIAEDEALDAAEAAAAEATSAADNAEAAAISTGEERIDPAQAEQDKADELAEVEAARTKLTREDVKASMTAYVKKYGMAATQEDGPKIFREALGEPPEGEAYWKLSLVPEDNQDMLAKAVAVWDKATSLNPLKREAV